MNEGCNEKGRARILIIDDTPDFLELLADLLEPTYEVMVADNAKRGMALARTQKFDLILLDIYMPDLNGYMLCEQLKKQSVAIDVPVVLMSGYIDAQGEARALDAGAADCLYKPLDFDVLNSRVRSLIMRKIAVDRMRDREVLLQEKLRQHTAHIEMVEQVALQTLVNVICARDIETGAHIVRTQAYVRMLAFHLAIQPRFAGELTPKAIELISKSAPLHDIGKVAIPDHILRKPGPLTPEEFSVMRTHPVLGLRALQSVEREHTDPPDFLRYAKDIVIAHHEKWDGSGYPYGLAGDLIPVAARLMAVADVYDALISRRVYKQSMSHEDAVQIMLNGSGSHFDPEITAAFSALASQFSEVAAQHKDSDSAAPSHD